MILADLIVEEHPEWDRYGPLAGFDLMPPCAGRVEFFIDPETPPVRIIVFTDFVRVTNFEGFYVSIPAADPQFFTRIRKAISEGYSEWKKNWR